MVCVTVAARLLAGGLMLAAVASSAWAAKTLDSPNPLAGTTNAGQVYLNWANTSGETGFLIERRLQDGGSFAEIGKTVADVASYTDILTTTDHYEYRVRAYKATGPSMIYSDYTNTVVSTAPCE